MMRVRGAKLWRDLWFTRGRVALMSAAIAASLLAGMSVLGAWTILRREMAVNYLGTTPASATLEMADGADAALVAAVRAQPGVADAELRDMVLGRARVGARWISLLLFVVDDFGDLRLNTFRLLQGAAPRAPMEALVERTALGTLGVEVGAALTVRTPHGAPASLRITGVVHDPGLAPAWQERAGYAFISRATLERLGDGAQANEIRVRFAGEDLSLADTEAQAQALARALGAAGREVHEISVPPPRRHPHQTQMATVLVLLLVFSALSLVLASVVVASSLSAWLTRQVREIGVMKTVGARTADLVGLYAGLVGAISLLALALALPLGAVAARLMSARVATLLNLDLTSAHIPAWVAATIAGLGLTVPLAIAAVPILRASRLSVRSALDAHEAANPPFLARAARLPSALRGALRRPARLALTVGLLAVGGAMFLGALNLSRAWDRNLEKIDETRFYDAEVRFSAPQDAQVAAQIAALPGVRAVERWGYAPTAFAQEGTVDLVHTWPDRRHGALAILAPPADSPLIRFPVLAGRWLLPSDTDAVVLNHAAVAQLPGVAVGDRILLSIGGEPTPWRVVGIVEEIGSAGVAYVTDRAYATASGEGDAKAMLRVAGTDDDPAARARLALEIEQTLDDLGAPITAAVPLAELRTAVSDHMIILIRLLLAMAVILAVVGNLGLASALSAGVVERAREIGVRKTLGATPTRIGRLFIAEALATAALSWPVAALLSLPLTWLLDAQIGQLGFMASLPFVVSWPGLAVWPVLTAVSAVVSAALPARQAGRISIREALGQV